MNVINTITFCNRLTALIYIYIYIYIYDTHIQQIFGKYVYVYTPIIAILQIINIILVLLKTKKYYNNKYEMLQKIYFCISSSVFDINSNNKTILLLNNIK